jgi:hypothetical protein
VGGKKVTRPHNLHRQIVLDEDERNGRIAEVCHEETAEQLIAKLMRAVRRIDAKNRAT